MHIGPEISGRAFDQEEQSLSWASSEALVEISF
jgi:hypothetical protein